MQKNTVSEYDFCGNLESSATSGNILLPIFRVYTEVNNLMMPIFLPMSSIS
jgi:hypothetical protein